jgi:serine protease Do
MVPLEFGEVAERLRRSTVQVAMGDGRERGQGSGVIWAADGLIVTNAHVAHGAEAKVSLWDGSTHKASVLNRDPRRDLASLRIAAAGLPAATAGDSSVLRAGELVIAVGNPMGFIGALTTGVVHSLPNRKRWVAADVRLAPGNSGGPLADARGRVIGINTMIAGGLALAVPSNAVGEFLEGKSSEEKSGPTIGVTIRPIPLRSGGLGFLLLKVDPASPAEHASLMIGDLLTGSGGKPFTAVDDLHEALASSGETLDLQFLRGDRRTTRTTTIRLRVREPEAA